MARNLIGMYRDIHVAEQVVKDLIDAGVPRGNISVVSHDAGQKYRDLSTVSDRHREENAVRGAGGGAIAGALGGALVSIGLAAIPGIGWIIAAGPIGSILATGGIGAAVGAAAGGVGGALSKVGVPERQAGEYAEAIRRGGTLVAVESPEIDIERAVTVMEFHDPVDLDKSSKRWRDQEGWTGHEPSAQPFTEAEASREREHWRTETRITTAATTFAVVPERQTTPVGGTPVDTTPIGDTSRNVPGVDEGRATQAAGPVGVFGGPGRSGTDVRGEFGRHEPTFRAHFGRTYASRGDSWDDHRDAYELGYLLARDEATTGDFSSVEADARARWQRKHGEQIPFDRVRDSVAFGFECARTTNV